MAKHQLELAYRVVFDDGTKKNIPIPEEAYYFHEQKGKYLIKWMEGMMLEEDIKAKPLYIEEYYLVHECEEYQIIIGV